MMNHFRIIPMMIVALLPGTAARGDAWIDRVDVELSTPRAVYLLGEPVPLDVTVRYRGAEEITPPRPPEEYIEVSLGPRGLPPQPIRRSRGVPDIGMLPAPLGPETPWTYQVRVVYRYEPGPEGPLPAFPHPGDYTAQVTLPLGGERLDSNPADIAIRSPSGSDAKVFEAINDERTRSFFGDPRYDEDVALKLARLLRDYPNTEYRESLLSALRVFYRFWKDNRSPSDPPPEAIRLALGEPDERLFPDDRRLNRKIALDFPIETPVRQVLASLTEQTGIIFTASPYYMLDRSVISISESAISLRELMHTMAPGPDAAWIERGDGYYLYCETLVGSRGREILQERLGPVEVLFPEDRRLDIEVVADFPEPTPIDRVLANYAEQSAILLDADPFFERCMQGNERMTFNLRDEMAFLARTFRGEWEQQDGRYSLSLPEGTDRGEAKLGGAEAERGDNDPLRSGMDPDVPVMRINGTGLAVLAIGIMAIIAIIIKN